MNGDLIEKTAKKLGWKLSEVDYALNELINSGSYIYSDEFYRICLNAKNPYDRWNNIIEYLLNIVSDSTIELISKLIHFDSSFNLLAFSNITDYVTEPITDYKYKIINKGCEDIGHLHYTNNYKSFINWELIYQFEDISGNISLKQDISTDPDKLRYKFLNIFLKKNLDIEKGTFDIDSLIIKLVRETGLLCTNLEFVRNYISPINSNLALEKNRKILQKLKSAIRVTYNEEKEINDRKYWLWYALIELMSQKGIGIRPSTRKAEKVLDEVNTTIARRYFEKSNEAKNNKLTLKYIINKYDLKSELDNYIKELEIN